MELHNAAYRKVRHLTDASYRANVIDLAEPKERRERMEKYGPVLKRLAEKRAKREQ